MSLIFHAVVSFDRNEEGGLVPLRAVEVPNSGVAQRAAERAAVMHTGAIAFSRTADPETGEFAPAVILGAYGEVDASLLTDGA